MKSWEGSAGVCINKYGEILMVLQGTEDEEKLWAVPAGGKETGETFDQCCIREVLEETGYEVEIVRQLFMKTGLISGVKVKVQYFEIKVTGGDSQIQDPDGLIHEIAWKKVSEMSEADFGFKEDREFLMKFSVSLQA
ncbi:NUDIX hydrolase [Mesobacillus subterraneus]|uniref:NUDIX hydrolase n=1 Tax=Mesobacillus subterraneus TaxID=285983 RepID=UPI001CFCFC0F|nr:NUDIX hydrolase [Mesobacillus subterraneus]WLR54206.1 NUDIX hydrolase [Mesobacillus subterraneus]